MSEFEQMCERLFPKMIKSEQLGKIKAKKVLEGIIERLENKEDPLDMGEYLGKMFIQTNSRNTKYFYREIANMFLIFLQTYCIGIRYRDDYDKLTEFLIGAFKDYYSDENTANSEQTK